MKSKLEQKIMKRVFLISLYKSIRMRVPLKVFALSILFSISTKVISYKIIYGYISNMDLSAMISYAFFSTIHAPVLKLLLLSIVLILAISIIVDLVRRKGLVSIHKGLVVRG